MKYKLQKIAGRITAAFAAISTLMFYAYAGMDNPATGDTQGRYIGVIIAVLVISLVVVIVLAVMSSKKKK